MEFITLILTSILSAVALFVIAKIMGHKQMSQLDFFDYITGITMGKRLYNYTEKMCIVSCAILVALVLK